MERSIGKFEVVEKIGEGGFGVIYKGLDPVIKRHVAIKCCTSDDQEVRDRFFHEARIAGNLHHRNVVTVYDFGLEDGVPYLVQEYLSGEDLDRKIKRKEYIPFPEKLLCLMQIARGLEYAHSQGVIHRDVKPANVRILEDGTAKLMDFGIAKLANQETGLTQTGMTLGTAAYLAPEQIRGEPVDRRTDIFSYGVMAYELLSYQRPFAGQHISTVLYQILNERPVPLRERFPECPERLEGLVARCLEKDPKRRYPSCAELLRDLDAMLRERRSARDTGNVLLAADLMASEMAATRAMRPAPPGATEPSVAAAHDGLDDLELAGGIDGDRTPRSISGTRAFRQRGFPWFRWIAATLLMAAAAVAVWQLRERSDRDSRGLATAETTPVAMAAAGGADAGAGPGGDATTARLDGAGGGEGPSDPAGAVAPPAAAPAQTPAGPDPPAADAVPSLAEAPAPETAPEPASEPPPPEPGRVVVARSWSPEIYVSVDGGPRHRLDGERSFQVPPGQITVRFTYRDGEYSDSAQTRVTVGEGKTVRPAMPLQRPGSLRVQPFVNTPPGEVFLDGAPLGRSPVTVAHVRPGPHQLRIERQGPAGQEVIEAQVEIASGTLHTATFDLGRGQLVNVHPRPLD